MMMHVAVAVPPTSVTTSLRRLVDRFGVVEGEPVCRDAPVPDWGGQRLPVIDEIMTVSDRFAEADRRACPDAVNAVFSRHRTSETFDGSIVEFTTSVALVQLSVPTVLTPVVTALGGCRGHGQVEADRCWRPQRPAPDGRG